MNNKDIIEDGSRGESHCGEYYRTAKVIPLRRPDNSTEGFDNSIDYQANIDNRIESKQSRIIKDFRDKVPFDQIRNKAEKELMDYAYNLIVDVLDNEIDLIERSNLFDEWKDTVNTIIAEITSVSVNHRKILGSIIVATRGKDITDFTQEGLNILKDSSYMLRQFRLTRNDSKRTIQKLINISDNMAIPLAADHISDIEETSLDQLMSSLIKMSK